MMCAIASSPEAKQTPSKVNREILKNREKPMAILRVVAFGLLAFAVATGTASFAQPLAFTTLVNFNGEWGRPAT
jgi:hypothetical protein